MAMAVKDENTRRSRSPLTSSPSPSPPHSLEDYELLPHPTYTPRTMKRKRKPPGAKVVKSLQFPGTLDSERIVPSSESSSKARDERKNHSGTTSDYGTLSVQNCIEVDSILSNSLSSMSLLGSESRHYECPMEILRVNNSSFVIFPHPISYNLRSSFSVDLRPDKVLLQTCSLIQIGEAIFVTKYNLPRPALFCMRCYSPRVHVYKRLISTFNHIATVNVRGELLVFEVDSEGTYAIFEPVKQPVVKYVTVSPRRATNFRLTDDPDPLVEVVFDRESVERRIRLKGQVFFEELHSENECLASPIISLSPHGAMFDKDVQIRIEILGRGEFSDGNLRLYVDRRNLEFKWSLLTDFEVIQDENGKNFVVFSVRHFSLFKVVWEGVKRGGKGLISSLLGRSSGAAESFQMKCQASMDEYDNNRFGLEVCVFKADKSFPEVMNYTHIVGKSLSKNVLCGGKLTISLKSKLFRADTEAGEQEEMVKDENDFKGQDFSRDFALVFKENITQRRGPFGKVFVSRSEENRSKETIFEFNIQKQGNEAERPWDKGAAGPGSSNVAEQWSTVPLEELATNLFITDGDNWKKLAKYLGFTKAEIKRFKTTPSPFISILDAFKSRGGEVKNFVKSIYETNREIKMGSQGITGSPMSDSSKLSPGRVSRSASSGLGSSRHSQNQLYQRTNTISSSSTSDTSDEEKAVGGSNAGSSPPPVLPEERAPKRKRAKGGGKHSHRKRRRREATPSSSSSYSSSEEDLKTNKNSSHNSKISDKTLRSDTRRLTESYLWNLSKFLTNSQWKAVGRTLQVEESQLTGISTQHANGGNREHYYQMLLAWSEKYPSKCTFGTLYSALVKENMVSAAKKMEKVFRQTSASDK